jgi:hypothetical protein
VPGVEEVPAVELLHGGVELLHGGIGLSSTRMSSMAVDSLSSDDKPATN